jgi:hypothetical protein
VIIKADDVPVERRLHYLAAVHFAFGFVAGILAPIRITYMYGPAGLLPILGLDMILIVPVVASCFCQAVLLGLWAGWSRTNPWARLAGLAAGSALLELLPPEDLRREFAGIFAATAFLSVASVLALRAWGISLNRPNDRPPGDDPAAAGPRFSIRSLMVLTAGIALIGAWARAMPAGRGTTRFPALTWATLVLVSGLLAAWAVLGRGRPGLRWPIALSLTAALGAAFAASVSAHREGWVYILLIMEGYGSALLSSLLVVRSCGYRIVRHSKTCPVTVRIDGRAGETR